MNTQQTLAARASYDANNGLGQDAVAVSLCSEIMGRTNVQAEQAAAIASRLWSLRDRLFGSQPEAGIGGEKGLSQAPQAFADSWRSRNGDLGHSLDDIDRLVLQLSDRL